MNFRRIIEEEYQKFLEQSRETATDFRTLDAVEQKAAQDALLDEYFTCVFPHPGEGKETLVETLPGGQATDEPVTAEEKSQPLVPETVDTPPVPTRVLEDANVRRTKVFPKKTAPAEPEAPYSPFIPDQAFKEITEAKPAPVTRAPGVPPDYEDGDYVVINGERFHKKAVPRGYIQNEEQQESNLWSNTVSNNNPQAITSRQYIDTAKNSI
jgi:hypothetical protein